MQTSLNIAPERVSLCWARLRSHVRSHDEISQSQVFRVATSHRGNLKQKLKDNMNSFFKGKIPTKDIKTKISKKRDWYAIIDQVFKVELSPQARAWTKQTVWIELT